MNKPLSIALAASLLALPSFLHADDTLKDDQAKVSYSMGVKTGENFHHQGIDVNADAFAEGLKDGIAGGTFKMTNQEMAEAINGYFHSLQAKMMAQEQQLAQKNLKEGAPFLEKNKKKAGWKVTSSGLQYKVLTTGTGDKPKASDTIVVNYRGTKIDGTEFDSSYKRNEPAEFQLGQMIPGWVEALQMMPVGSKWQLAIPAGLAYGDKPNPQLGGNCTLLFDVELLSIKKPETSGTSAPQ